MSASLHNPPLLAVRDLCVEFATRKGPVTAVRSALAAGAGKSHHNRLDSFRTYLSRLAASLNQIK